MKLTTHLTEESCIIKMKGDLDACSSVLVDAELEKAIKKELPNLLIDFEEVDYISSTGLGVFISHLHTVQSKKIKLVLYAMSDKIRNVFSILGLQNLVAITETEEEAITLCQEVSAEKN